MVVIILFSIDSEEYRAFVDIFLLEFPFQNLFWSFLIEFSFCKPRKP